MPEMTCPIPKILIPVDDTDESRHVLEYAACLAMPYGDALRGITLLHVIGAGYLTSHAGYVDLRVLRVEESAAFQRIRQMHYEADIFPMLDKAARMLTSLGVPELKIDRLIKHGREGKAIVEQARAGNYSTIILGRTVFDEEEDEELGGVTQTVIQKASGITVYVAGKRILEDMACPIPRILVAVDGSDNSMKALEHALCMVQAIKGVSKIMVLCVQGPDEIDAKKVLAEAEKIIQIWAPPEGLVQMTVRRGDPAKTIATEAELGEYTTVVLGRRGPNAPKHLTIGAVPLTVIHRTVSPAVALVSQ
jgi:nucleotide-binding universal stress UspA family protein